MVDICFRKLMALPDKMNLHGRMSVDRDISQKISAGRLWRRTPSNVEFLDSNHLDAKVNHNHMPQIFFRNIDMDNFYHQFLEARSYLTNEMVHDDKDW